MEAWTPIPGLTAKAQSLYRQSASLVQWLTDNPDGGEHVRSDIWDELDRVERSIANLTQQQKYKEDLPAVAATLTRIEKRMRANGEIP